MAVHLNRHRTDGAEVETERVRSKFSANDFRINAKVAGRKLDQTLTLQFSWARLQGSAILNGFSPFYRPHVLSEEDNQLPVGQHGFPLPAWVGGPPPIFRGGALAKRELSVQVRDRRPAWFHAGERSR